jgi:hypothetical protein
VRTQSGTPLRPELGAGEGVQRAAQVRHRQSAVHRQALHLIEDRRMGGVEFVGAEGAADRHDVHRQLAFQQRADLHRRGVGTQNQPRSVRADLERVLFAAGRVIGREVQRVEVELLGLDLGAFGQFPTHRDEHVGDVIGEDGDGMPGPDRLAGRRQRHVNALRNEGGSIAFGAQDLDSGVERDLHGRAGLVDAAAGIGAVCLGESAERLPGQGDGRPVAEVLGLGAGQSVEVAGLLEGMTGRADRSGQRFLRQSRRVRLINHPAIIATGGV